jgi:hypothetical protein
VVKVRLCLRRTNETASWTDTMRRIYRFEGPKAFWRGYALNQLGIVPYAGFDLACYEVRIRYAWPLLIGGVISIELEASV